MKFNWGIGITLAALAFIAFILQLVYRCSNEKIDLVSEHYYEQEIRYQDQIDRRNNVNTLQQKISINLDGRSLSLIYPSSVEKRSVVGTITLFRPDNSSLDFSVPVKVDIDSGQLVSLENRKSGKWKVQIAWSDGTTPYYQEESIWIN